MKHSRLTARERDVFKILVENQIKTNEQIGDILNLSPHTVAAHIRNILSKLELESRYEMLTYAIKNELYTPHKEDGIIVYQWTIW
ncbi:MAG: helix-turn-helix transcriptional regulator [Thermoflexibacter sp.]|jgi:DNA-binding CsgD family transcriptional regulator|nr:helix-turn-helix transcriptional regulator [Thermoflexibacter sp.]